MKLSADRCGLRAWTLIELLVTMAIVVILMSLILAAIAKVKPRVYLVTCASNLRQIGIAFHSWGTDHAEQFPMQVPVRNGGTLGLVSRGYALPNFWAVRKELGNPKILVCAADASRRAAAGFTPSLTFTNVSYLVGLDAAPAKPASLLSGDRNLELGGQPLGRGLYTVGARMPIGWTDEIHVHRGNLLQADGSVQRVVSPALAKTMEKPGLLPARLALP